MSKAISTDENKALRAIGKAAFEAGKPYADNPYPKHDPEHAQWMRGWIDGQMGKKPIRRR